jgi:hypothetical protein
MIVLLKYNQTNTDLNVNIYSREITCPAAYNFIEKYIYIISFKFCDNLVALFLPWPQQLLTKYTNVLTYTEGFSIQSPVYEVYINYKKYMFNKRQERVLQNHKT